MTSHLTELLTVAEAVAATGSSESTIRRRLRERAFPGAVREEPGKGWRIPRSDLIASGLLAPLEPVSSPPPAPGEGVDVAELAALRERAVRAETAAAAATREVEEARQLRTENADLRERVGRAEATAEARGVEVERLLHVVDRLTRAVGAAPDRDEEPRVVLHEVTAPDGADVEPPVEEDVEAPAAPAAPAVDEDVQTAQERPGGAWAAVRGWFGRR